MMKPQRDSKDKSGLGYVSEQPSTSNSAQKKLKDESANSELENQMPHRKGTTLVHNGRKNVAHQHQQARWSQQLRIPSFPKVAEKKTSTVAGIRNKEHKAESSKAMAKDQEVEHRRINNKKRIYQGETHEYHKSSWPQ